MINITVTDDQDNPIEDEAALITQLESDLKRAVEDINTWLVFDKDKDALTTFEAAVLTFGIKLLVLKQRQD